MTSLTGEQEQAVARRSEPLLLSAGAGSGKTSVLVERFVRAVMQDGVAAGKILAITFTERAAGELRERVRTRFLELGEREAARDTEAAFVSTFHGFCARLLRVHPLMAGLDPEFAILEEGLAGRLRKRAFRAALREFLDGERAEAVDVLAAFGVDRVESMVEGVYAELRSRGQRLPRLPVPPVDPDAEAVDVDGAAACVLIDELLEAFGRCYELLKRRRGAVDFDDLELCARELLDEHDGVRANWSERFELLMVDEFQDTNPRQLAILRALDRGNLFTVGDELQSIYGFRHADVGLFRERRAELAESGGSLVLTCNFRGRPPLLDVVNTVFAQRFGAGFTPLAAGREDAGEPGCAEGAQAAGEPLVELLLTARRGWAEDAGLGGAIAGGLPAAPIWRQAEARMLAQRVAELVEGGRARAGEVVVLLRAVGDLEVYERALQLRGLRTLAAVGGFWGRQQTGDLLAYLRALANPLDEQALYEVLASPLAGLSSDGLALLARAAHTGGRGVWETALRVGEDEFPERMSDGDRDVLEGFCMRLRAERAAAPRRTISQLIERAIEASGYREHVLALEWGERRLANVHKLLRVARRFEAGEGRDLRAFLDHVAHLKDATSAAEPDAPVDGVEPDAIRLMTIHAAKGLEFPVVCVADLGRAQNLGVPELLVEGDRVGLRVAQMDGAQAIPSLEFEPLCEERRLAQAEEEDRILYVAMTRARERLLLSGAVDFERWPEPRQGAASIAWLGPALAPELPELVGAGERAVFDLPVGGAVARCVLNAPATLGTVLRLDVMSLPPERAPSSAQATDADGGSSRSVEADGHQKSADPLAGISTLSYTSLSELERCGYRYYLERVLGLAEDRSAARSASGHGLEARARGTLVHRLLESIDFARPAAPAAGEVGRLARELGLRVGAGEREEIAALIGAAIGSAPAERIARAEGVRREHPFAFAVGDDEALITGVVDLLASERDGGLVVVDYKSDRVGPEVDLGALVERDYGVQRLLYALAVLRGGAAAVEIVHWFLERPGEWVSARYLAADRGKLEARIGARIERARARGFAVSSRPHRALCLTCPGRGGLCSWSEAETLREDPVPEG